MMMEEIPKNENTGMVQNKAGLNGVDQPLQVAGKQDLLYKPAIGRSGSRL